MVVLSNALPCFAQERSTYPNFRRNTATIIFCGLGGAVLGLSTLSFYGQPQDHLSNIYVGLGVGLMAGGGYVYYRSLPQLQDRERFESYMGPKMKATPVQFAYAWDF